MYGGSKLGSDRDGPVQICTGKVRQIKILTFS